MPALHLTLMRPPFVKTPTTPESGLCSFLPRAGAWRRQQLGSWSDVMSVGRCQPHVAAPHTYGGAVATCMTMAEHRWWYPLRPSNHAVPSSRPMPRAGCTGPARQCVSGSGEGQPTPALGDHRRLVRSPSGCPITAPGSGPRGLYTPSRSETPPKRAGRVVETGCSRGCPGRREAHPRCSPEPQRKLSRSHTVSRWSLEESARAS